MGAGRTTVQPIHVQAVMEQHIERYELTGMSGNKQTCQLSLSQKYRPRASATGCVTFAVGMAQVGGGKAMPLVWSRKIGRRRKHCATPRTWVT
jgi:hypothetical protein